MTQVIASPWLLFFFVSFIKAYTVDKDQAACFVWPDLNLYRPQSN